MYTMSSPWDSIRPIFDDLVSVMRPSAFVDRLFSQRVITREEYSRLRALPTSFDQSRFLLNDVLPSKSQEHYYAFIDCLKRTEGQAHIAEMLAKSSSGSARRTTASTERRADEKPLDDKMKSRLTKEIDTKDIRCLYTKVCHKWKTLGRMLRPDVAFEDFELDQIEKDKPDDQERAYELLKRWREKVVDKATVCSVCCSLVEAGLPDVARKVFGADVADSCSRYSLCENGE